MKKLLLSSLLFSFVIDMRQEITLSPSDLSKIDLPLGDSLVGLECTDNIAVFDEYADELQSSDHLKQQCENV